MIEKIYFRTKGISTKSENPDIVERKPDDTKRECVVFSLTCCPRSKRSRAHKKIMWQRAIKKNHLFVNTSMR